MPKLHITIAGETNGTANGEIMSIIGCEETDLLDIWKYSIMSHAQKIADELGIALEPQEATAEDICGLCGLPGADKMPHPCYWPGERVPESELVHVECEQAECGRAHAALTDKQREDFLRTI